MRRLPFCSQRTSRILRFAVYLSTTLLHPSRALLAGTPHATCSVPPAVAHLHRQQPLRLSTSMAWLSSGRTNADLINNLYSNGLITSSRVKDAMLGVDRAHYAPSAPYTDSPQSIGHSATISAPHMHASASEALLPYLHPSARVLDIGSGSGYLCHVFANLIGATDTRGKVVGIEHIPQLVELAKRNLRKSSDGAQMLDTGHVRFVAGDGRKGLPEEGPYDAIHVGAAAKELHQALVDQLASPGRLFIPVEEKGGYGDQWIWVVDKDENGVVTKKRREGVRYVPLTDRPAI